MPMIALDSLAPDFSLKDINGIEINLGNFKGKKNILLVFNRGFT